jgi:hypothetical protein
MTFEELDEWAADFMGFSARFADVLGLKEPRAPAAKYLRGLLASLPRKNGWQVTEAIGDCIPMPRSACRTWRSGAPTSPGIVCCNTRLGFLAT